MTYALVTGISGFVGGHIQQYLADCEYETKECLHWRPC